MLRLNNLAGFGAGRAIGAPALGSTLWLTPESIQESGGTVTAWNDVSGNARHLTSVSGTPQYSAGGGVGGQAGVVFDGVNEALTSASVQQNDVFTAAAYTWFVVCNFTAIGTDSADISENEGPFGASNGRITFNARSSGPAHFSHFTSVDVADIVSGAATGTDFIAMGHYDGTTLTGRLNATVGAGATVGNATNIGDDLIVGRSGASASRFFEGVISEIILYNTALSAPARAQTLAYLSAKYGIAT